MEAEAQHDERRHGAERGGAPQWKLSTRVAFRFVFVYLVLYTLYAPIHFLAMPPIPQVFANMFRCGRWSRDG